MSKRHFDTKPTVIVILGQTATGKSDLAVKISRELTVGGVESEIISADSRQVYKGLDIGTGKITRKEMKRIPHHLLDVVSPKYKFTVTQFQKLANNKIEEILKRNKIPIICGGTGLYIDAITKGIIFPKVPPDFKLRRKLALVSERLLMLKLKKLDRRRAQSIDPKNKVRLIRAIEIAKALGKVPRVTEATPPYRFVKIGLCLPIDELKKKVEKRVRKMFNPPAARYGGGGSLLNEIKKLKKGGISDKRLKELGFEYDNPTPEKVIKATLDYAKRQITWFKRDPEIKWFSRSPYKKVATYLKKKI